MRGTQVPCRGGCGLRAAGCGLRAAGCGLRAAGCEARAESREPRAERCEAGGPGHEPWDASRDGRGTRGRAPLEAPLAARVSGPLDGPP
ncbi:hypothetical protein C6Q10_21590 [Burkholderia multivorans]|nr:hypothetical protein C6Q10_21590 [Burkholderia multivorans]